MRNALRVARLCALLLITCPPPAAATSPKASPPPKANLTITDIAELRPDSVDGLSVQGSAILAVRHGVDQPDELVRFQDGAAHLLARGQTGSVSPDGRWSLVLSGSQWQLRDIRLGLLRILSLPRRPWAFFGTPVWSTDSRYVAAHFDLPDGAAPAPSAPTLSHGVKIEVIDDSPAAIRQRASVHLNPRLLIWDVKADRPFVAAPPVSETYPGSWGPSATGRPLYVYAAGQHPYGGQTPFTVIRIYAPQSNTTTEVYQLGSYSQNLRPQISPDGRSLAFAADVDDKAFGVSASVMVEDLRTGRVRRLTHDLSVSDVQWGCDGALYFLMRHGGLQQLAKVDLTGKAVQLTHDAVNRKNLVASLDHAVLAYTTGDGYGRKTIRTWLVRTAQERQVAIIADPGRRYRLGQFQSVSWRTPDEVRLRGFVIRPPGYVRGRRYPMLVDVHGGGPGAPLYLFGLLGFQGQTPLEWHLWASLGYMVFVPDYRSSGEYGVAINRARTLRGERTGDLGGIAQDAADVASGVRWMIRSRMVDPRRIAIMGQSAGGARVNFLLTRSKLFAAGIIHDQIDSGPQAEALEQARLALPITWYGQHPSPAARTAQLSGFLFDGWRSRTPTLIMVGNPDLGALDPLSAETLYAMLLSVHVPTRFVRFPQDGHNVSSSGGSEARFDEIKAWLDCYVPARRWTPRSKVKLGDGAP